MYLPDFGKEPLFRLAWVDREGERGTFGQPRSYGGFRMSPDGKDFVVIGKKAGRADLLLVRRDGTKKTITYEVGAP